MATSSCNPTSFLRFSSSPPVRKFWKITNVQAGCSVCKISSIQLSPSKNNLLLRSALNGRNVRFRSEARSISSGKSSIRCGVTLINESEFSEKVLMSDIPVLVEFVADWCGPCRLISPVVDWASQEYKERLKVVKIDHDSNPHLIEEYKVYGLPTLILFKNGQQVPESRREGAITKVKLKEYLEPLLDSM